MKNYLGKKVIYYNKGQQIFSVNEGGIAKNHILDIRGWGVIEKMFKNSQEAFEFQDEVGEWVADAINEKLKREWRDDEEEDGFWH